MKRQIVNANDSKDKILMSHGEHAEETCAGLIAKYCFLNGRKVTLITCKPIENVIQDILCYYSGISSNIVLSGKISEREWQEIVAASHMLMASNLKIFHYDASSAEEIKRQCVSGLNNAEYADLVIFFAQNLKDEELSLILYPLKERGEKLISVIKI